MSKTGNQETLRFYAQAEAYVEQLDLEPGEAAQTFVRMRFKTLDILEEPTPGTTPWVSFSVPMLERLATQLSAVVEEAKRWESGAAPGGVGENIGVVARSVPPAEN